MLFHILGSSASFPLREECSGLGLVEHQNVKESLKNMKKKGYAKFTENERFLIGKYAAIHGPTAAVRKLKKTYPHLDFGESQARALNNQNSANVDKRIVPLKRGRTLLLGSIDEKVGQFLQVMRRKGGVVNTVVDIATAKALIAKNDLEHLKVIDLSLIHI